MGLLTNSINEIREDVFNHFGNASNYLVGMKKNKISNNILYLILSNLFYVLASTRTFIICFTNEGIYEKEISNSLKTHYVLIPWNEISNFSCKKAKKKSIIEYTHQGKTVVYEINYHGVPYQDNQANELSLSTNNWNK